MNKAALSEESLGAQRLKTMKSYKSALPLGLMQKISSSSGPKTKVSGPMPAGTARAQPG